MAMKISGAPQVFTLSPGQQIWSSLTHRERLYAHHSAKTAWYGARIIRAQTSPESNQIIDAIIRLHRLLDGNWSALAQCAEAPHQDASAFLNYAAVVLDNVGNFAGKGDYKFVPAIPTSSLLGILKLCGDDVDARRLTELITSRQPSSLGFADANHQSTYYPGSQLAKSDVEEIDRALIRNGVGLENSRLVKVENDSNFDFGIMQASEMTDIDNNVQQQLSKQSPRIRLMPGDHAGELENINKELDLARQYAANPFQVQMLDEYIRFFRAGNIQDHRASQISWIRDRLPTVEVQLGFIEPYRDPAGVRGEFEGIVGLADTQSAESLRRLAENCETFIRTLPWIQTKSGVKDKGPWERETFETPDIAYYHMLAYCSSMLFAGINLPNYNDIRQKHGSKNLLISNLMEAHSSRDGPNPPFIHPDDLADYLKTRTVVYRLQVLIHELLGHGTGLLLSEADDDGRPNFDLVNLPLDPRDGSPISTWYRDGETFNTVFGDLATTIDECRAECVGHFLLDNRELVALFGYDDGSEITASQIEYNGYLQLVASGLHALAVYNPESREWGQAHAQAHFAMLQAILAEGAGFITFEPTEDAKSFVFRLDRAKMQSQGREGLRKLLLNLHVFRSSANVRDCRTYYGKLTEVHDEALKWREAVIAAKGERQVFAQANTRLREDGEVELIEYPTTLEGLVQSWADRHSSKDSMPS